MVSDCAPLFVAELVGVRLDEQRVESAGLLQRVQLVVAGPVEEGAVGVDQLVEPIDQHADRQAVEDRALIGGGRPRGCRFSWLRPWSRSFGAATGFAAETSGFGGSAGSGRGVVKLFRLVLGAAQPRGETVRQFAERVALDRRQRRHVFRRWRGAGTARHSPAAAPLRAPGARRGTPAVRRAAAAAAPARRVFVSSLMRATSRQMPKPR